MPRTGDGGGAFRLVVPAYFHPATHRGEWEWLAQRAARLRLVVLNMADGPGGQPDPAYGPVLERLRAAGVPVAGYVDTDCGRRPEQEVTGDLRRFLDWYQVDGVFFDRVSAAAADIGHYAGLAAAARDAGAGQVVLNHGTFPPEQYAEHADLLGTFEGPWTSYLSLAVPPWARSCPPGRFFHLVHAAPPRWISRAGRLAAGRHAACGYLTDRAGANPWGGLPAGSLARRTG